MHITAKPTSYQCNIQCDYCFYLGKAAQFSRQGWMDDQTLRSFIKNYIRAASDNVHFTWQGGEPTMAGVDFFRKAVALQKKYGGGKKIFNALQTNGILLNDEWCQFLKQHDFLVGISIDGPEALHDRYRQTRAGNGTFKKVISAIDLLKKYGVEFNTLTVVNNINVGHPLEVYEFLKSIGSRHLQFIELLETSKANIQFDGRTDVGNIIDFSVPAVSYGKFMSEIFKRWVKYDVGTVFVRQFETFVSRFLGNGHTSCIFQQACRDNFVMESNGDLYECDHFVYPQYKIGNISDASLSSLQSSRLTAQKQVLSSDCLNCIYKPVCNGGCPKHRIIRGGGGQVSYFCAGYKTLFATMTPYMNAFVELARNGIPLEKIMDIAEQIESA
ncbi:anaerobic sulfatase maturase [Dryocola clanedunensis]|uniref:anaerobic sulfatase maturase n=1 Tax=Cedecea sulfonylureivorans TaxID=3051154 RepID=UPI001925C5D1|nr:anaerobic sulfatase maturase [Cedecea sulfonylureivorans]